MYLIEGKIPSCNCVPSTRRHRGQKIIFACYKYSRIRTDYATTILIPTFAWDELRELILKTTPFEAEL